MSKRPLLALLTLLFAAASVSNADGQDQTNPLAQTQKQQAKDKEQSEIPNSLVQVYALRFVSAVMAHETLEVLLDSDSARIVVDERTNRLVVVASKETHVVIEKLLQNMDIEIARPQTSVIPAKKKANMLRDMMKQLDMKIDIAVDPALETLIIRGKKEDVEHAQSLIAELEKILDRDQMVGLADRQFTIELFTFASGKEPDNADFQNQDLVDVKLALSRKGITNPVIFAQTQILTVGNSEFLAEDGTHTVAGQIVPTPQGVKLEIQVELRTDEKSPPRIFETTVMMKLDHPVIFAATKPNPTAGTQVFAVRVRLEE